MTVVTDIDHVRRLRSGRNAALLILGVTATGFWSDYMAWFVLTINALIWLILALEKAAQLKMLELVEADGSHSVLDATVSSEARKRELRR
jgi:hypothetical protein